jgi:hypothetical protein
MAAIVTDGSTYYYNASGYSTFDVTDAWAPSSSNLLVTVLIDYFDALTGGTNNPTFEGDSSLSSFTGYGGVVHYLFLQTGNGSGQGGTFTFDSAVAGGSVFGVYQTELSGLTVGDPGGFVGSFPSPPPDLKGADTLVSDGEAILTLFTDVDAVGPCTWDTGTYPAADGGDTLGTHTQTSASYGGNTFNIEAVWTYYPTSTTATAIGGAMVAYGSFLSVGDFRVGDISVPVVYDTAASQVYTHPRRVSIRELPYQLSSRDVME